MIQLIKPKDTWITIAQFMNMLHLIYSINFPYKLVKSYKAIKDQCGFLSHSNFELYWLNEVSLFKDLYSHFFWFLKKFEPFDDRNASGVKSPVVNGGSITISRYCGLDSSMFQNLPTISALADPFTKTCRNSNQFENFGKLRYHIERQLENYDKLWSGTVCCITSPGYCFE